MTSHLFPYLPIALLAIAVMLLAYHNVRTVRNSKKSERQIQVEHLASLLEVYAKDFGNNEYFLRAFASHLREEGRFNPKSITNIRHTEYTLRNAAQVELLKAAVENVVPIRANEDSSQ